MLPPDLPCQRSRIIVRLVAVLLVLLAVAVLLDWLFNNFLLKGVLPGLPTMKVNTACALLFCALALWLLAREARTAAIRSGASILACVVLLLGAVTLAEDVFEWDLGIDQVLMADLLHGGETNKPGRMAPPSAFCFVLSGIALLVAANWKPTRHQLAVVFALAAMLCLISGLTLLGHGSSLLLQFRFWNYGGMAVSTAIGLALTGVALMGLVLCEQELDWSVDAMSTSGFVVGVFSLLAAASISYSVTWQLTQDAARVSHSQEVLKSIEEVKSGMADLESIQRGYILTGNEKLIVPDVQIQNGINNNLRILRGLVADSQQQLQRLNRLQELVLRRYQWEQQTIFVRKQFGFPAAQQLIMSGTGIALSEQVHQMLGMMRASEYVVLGQNQAQSVRTSNKTFLLLPLGVFMSLTLLSLGLAFLNSGLAAGKQAEHERRESEAWFRNLFETTLDGIIIVDEAGIIGMANPAANRMFGRDAVILVGTQVERLLSPADRAPIMAHWGELACGGVPQQIDAQKSDGSVFPVEWTRSTWCSARGRFTCVIMRDITERRQLEQQLRQSQKMEAVGQLTGGIAHDFNNLLGVIIGNLDLLERLVADNAAALKRLHTARNAAIRGANLTRRMLAFSSEQALSPVATLLIEPIHNMIEMTARAVGPDIHISTRLDPALPPVLVDVAGLENVLLNLIVNARDAMPSGGTITIASELSDLESGSVLVKSQQLPAGRYARITVTDEGCGMTAATRERVFEPFFTTKARGKGTGLGMAMVYGFIQRSGGTIRIYSEVGHGTSVSLYLPLATEALVPRQVHDPVAQPRMLKGKVLVVDDEVNLLEIAVIYLEEMGLTVFHAQDGASAMAILAQQKDIDLLVTDIIMPGGMNGVALARAACRMWPQLRIVYSSGFPSDALAERSGGKIEGPLINKPYQREDFVQTIIAIMTSGADALPLSATNGGGQFSPERD